MFLTLCHKSLSMSMPQQVHLGLRPHCNAPHLPCVPRLACISSVSQQVGRSPLFSSAVQAASSSGAAGDLPTDNVGQGLYTSSGSSSRSSPRGNGSSSSSSTADGSSRGPLQWLRDRFGSSKLDKQKLAEYGLGAFAAYGIISNLNAGVLVTMAWLTVVKQTGLTPIDAGMWPRFLGIYAGLYVAIGSILRPLRLTLALALAPFFNKALDQIQAGLRVNKAVAFGVMLCCIAVTSFSFISCMLILAGGFPNGVPQLPWKR